MALPPPLHGKAARRAMSVTPPPLAERLAVGRIIAAGETVAGIDRTVAGFVLDPPGSRRRWIAGAGLCALLVLLGAALLPPIAAGLGLRAVDDPLVRAMDVAGVRWWIGLASGSLLVSAVMLLAGAEWRCAVTRIAETVALIGAVAAWLFPLLRAEWSWALSWTRPLLDPMDPAGQSPLLPAWEAAGAAPFLVLCLSLWSIGLLPDLAILRDRVLETAAERAPGGAGSAAAMSRARIYGLLAGGWRGSATQWQRWVEAYRAVSLLGALLVIALQTDVSVRLAGSALPGRHDTLLPVTVLVGAVLSGVGVTAALVVSLRTVCRIDALVTERHLDILARMILVLGLASLYCHAAEVLTTLLHGDVADRAAFDRRIGGEHAWAFWTGLSCGLLPVHVFWLPGPRRSGVAVALVGLLAAIGIYADQFMILADALPQAAAPSPVGSGAAGITGIAGSVGLFLLLLLLALRTVPIVSIAQTRLLAITHNPGQDVSVPPPAGSAEFPDAGASSWGIAAEFASERELDAAYRALSGRDRGLRLDAYGPVPMPGLLDVMRQPERPLRRSAIAGVLAGGTGFTALCLGWTLWLDPLGGPRPSWFSLVLPGLSVAMMTGALAVHAALLVRNRPARADRTAGALPGILASARDRYVLAAESGGTEDAGSIVRRLAALPEGDGRPLAIRPVPR